MSTMPVISTSPPSVPSRDDPFISQYGPPEDEFSLNTNFKINSCPSSSPQFNQVETLVHRRDTQDLQEDMYSQFTPESSLTSLIMGLDPHSLNDSGISTTDEILNSPTPKFPPHSFDVPDISLSLPNSAVVPGMEVHQNSQHPDGIFNDSLQDDNLREIFCADLVSANKPSDFLTSMHLSPPQAFSQPYPSQAHAFLHNAPTRDCTLTTCPAEGESNEDSDDCLPLAQLVSMKRAAAAAKVSMAPNLVLAAISKVNCLSRSNSVDSSISLASFSSSVAGLTTVKEQASKNGVSASAVIHTKKQKVGVAKKRRRDTNELQKPVSAYALFFRDTQSAIKGQNPNATFGEVSKIVAAMWDSLNPAQKETYKKTTETLKKDYLKQLAAYRAKQISQSPVAESSDDRVSKEHKSPPSNIAMAQRPYPVETSFKLPLPDSLTSLLDRQTYGTLAMQPGEQCIPPDKTHSLQQQQRFTEGTTQSVVSSASVHHTGTSLLNSAVAYFHQEQLTARSSSPQGTPITVPLEQCVQRAGLDGVWDGEPLCVRDGCCNMAVDDPGWDTDYCSNECVVRHCRDVFDAWVVSRTGAPPFSVN